MATAIASFFVLNQLYLLSYIDPYGIWQDFLFPDAVGRSQALTAAPPPLLVVPENQSYSCR